MLSEFQTAISPKNTGSERGTIWTITGENKAKGIQVGAESNQSRKRKLADCAEKYRIVGLANLEIYKI